jgi:hypothetical protein
MVTCGVRFVSPLKFTTTAETLASKLPAPPGTLLLAGPEGRGEQPPSHRRSIRRSCLARRPARRGCPPWCDRWVAYFRLTATVRSAGHERIGSALPKSRPLLPTARVSSGLSGSCLTALRSDAYGGVHDGGP